MKRKIYILIPILTLSIFITQKTYAGDIQQPFSDYTVQAWDYLYQQFTVNTTTTINEFTLWDDSFLNINDLAYEFIATTTPNANPSTGTELWGDANGTSCGNPCTISIPTTTLSTGIYYTIGFWRRFNPLTTSTYSNDVSQFLPNATRWTCINQACTGGLQMYSSSSWTFKLTETLLTTSTILDTISITNPSSTQTWDFTDWETNSSIKNNYTTNYQTTADIYVKYIVTSGTTSTTYIDIEERPIGDVNAITFIKKSQKLAPLTTSTPTYVEAQAELYIYSSSTGEGTLIATSPVLNFTITATTTAVGNSLIDPSKAKEILEALQERCAIWDIGCQMKKAFFAVIDFIIIPHDFVKSAWTNALDYAKSTFPFNIIYETSETVQTIGNAEASSTTANTWEVQIKGDTFTLLTSSTLAGVMGTSTKAVVFTFLENFIWLGTGLIILFTLI